MVSKLTALALATSCLLAQNTQEIKDEIKETKERIARLNANLKELESSVPKEDALFKTRAEAGYMLNSGNSDTEAFNVDAKITGTWDLHSLEMGRAFSTYMM